MGIGFKNTAASGHLASPEFPNIHRGKIDTTCMLTASKGEIEVAIAHLVLEQGQDCKDYLEVVSEKETAKLCKAGRQSYTAESFILSFRAANDNGISAVWLMYKGVYKISSVKPHQGGFKIYQ